jgi:hypothetical protein
MIVIAGWVWDFKDNLKKVDKSPLLGLFNLPRHKDRNTSVPFSRNSLLFEIQAYKCWLPTSDPLT